MTTDSSSETPSETFKQEPPAFMVGEEQSGVYEQFEEEMDASNNTTVKESFPDSVKGFTLDDTPPSQWRDKILEFHSWMTAIQLEQRCPLN